MGSEDRTVTSGLQTSGRTTFREIIGHLQAIWRQGAPAVAKELQSSVQKAMRRMVHFELYNVDIWRSINALVVSFSLCTGTRQVLWLAYPGGASSSRHFVQGTARCYPKGHPNLVRPSVSAEHCGERPRVVRGCSGLQRHGRDPAVSVTTAMAEAVAVWRWKAEQTRTTSSAGLNIHVSASSDRPYSELGEAARQRILQEDLDVYGWTEDDDVFQVTRIWLCISIYTWFHARLIDPFNIRRECGMRAGPTLRRSP
ncbi:hypothetical protein K470DRAFT_259318 [Piedraia hortae CBS 480.64]|uniref:Uncharacterized protein n=1 Tax=Piedraia hortae CBS 480.64 TaxID=1314780 RepID=A0A6A7BUK9_9PEZI|nr:hypothetical protein K470DRAFT_259318 [Piedraia hortae CBS 480.64]